MTLDTAPDVLKPDDVAEILRCNVKTVYDLLNCGKIHAVKHTTRWFISKLSLRKFLGDVNA